MAGSHSCLRQFRRSRPTLKIFSLQPGLINTTRVKRVKVKNPVPTASEWLHYHTTPQTSYILIIVSASEDPHNSRCLQSVVAEQVRIIVSKNPDKFITVSYYLLYVLYKVSKIIKIKGHRVGGAWRNRCVISGFTEGTGVSDFGAM